MAMIIVLPPETFNLLSVFIGTVFCFWFFRIVHKFHKVIALRDAMRRNKIVHLPSIGVGLNEFEYAIDSHFRSLVMTRQNAPPVNCPTISIPFTLKCQTLKIKFDADEVCANTHLNIVFEMESSVTYSVQLVFGLKKTTLQRTNTDETNPETNRNTQLDEDNEIFEGGIEMKGIGNSEGVKLVRDSSPVPLEYTSCVEITPPELFEAGESLFCQDKSFTPNQLQKLKALKDTKDSIFVAIVVKGIKEGVMEKSTSSMPSMLNQMFDQRFPYVRADTECPTRSDLSTVLGINLIDEGHSEELVSVLYLVEFMENTPPVDIVAVTTSDVLSLGCIFGLTDQDEEGGSREECTVCLTDPKDTILLPCRHLCVCHSCFAHIDKCPVCRSPFQSHLLLEQLEETLNQTVEDKDDFEEAVSPLHGV